MGERLANPKCRAVFGALGYANSRRPVPRGVVGDGLVDGSRAASSGAERLRVLDVPGRPAMLPTLRALKGPPRADRVAGDLDKTCDSVIRLAGREAVVATSVRAKLRALSGRYAHDVECAEV